MKELHVKSLLPVRLDKYLMDQFPALGMGRLNKALRENKIKLNGKKQPLSTRVQNGDIIKLFLNDDQLENRPAPAAVFVYEDDDIMSSSGAQSNHINHVQTQMQYAMVVVAACVPGYLIAGFTENWLITLVSSLAILTAALLYLRRRSLAEDARA